MNRALHEGDRDESSETEAETDVCVCTACVPLEVDPDDGAEEVDDDEYGDEADDQVAGVGDDGARRVHVRHDRPTQLVAVQTELLPARHPPHARTHARRTVLTAAQTR